jgi:hypothetical protein
LRVELIRVVEDSSLGGAGRLPVVVGGDGVEELGENRRVEISCPPLDQAQPEVDVSEQSALLGLAKRGPATELTHTPDVVQERCSEQEVGAQARV